MRVGLHSAEAEHFGRKNKLFDVNTLDLNDWVFYRRRPEEE